MNTAPVCQNSEIAGLMAHFAGHIAGFYDRLADQPVCPPAEAGALEYISRQTIPAAGRPLRQVYQEMLQSVYAGTALLQHPRSFSCIPSTASLLSWMGDVMTNAFNPHHSCQMNAPAAALIEKKLIRWLCGLAGYPAEGGGLFVSGGSMANLTALTAARDAKLSWEQRSRAVIYVSDQTHSSVAKGLHIIGFHPAQIHIVPTDAAFRMDAGQLAQAIAADLAAGKRPFAAVASAGTTNTGSIDPLPEISALCRAHDMWLHADGAFGASALLSAEQRRALAGIEQSDSMSWDAHKWMMQTYGCGMVLVRDQSTLARSFAAHPEYLKDSETSPEGIEFWDLGPELTRPARCLKLWLTLQVLGSAELGRVVDHGCAMARLAEAALRKQEDWEIVSPAQLGIVTFRYAPAGKTEAELDRLNLDIAEGITGSGYAQIFTTVLRGKKVLRMCSINPQTRAEDILGTVQRLVSCQSAGDRRSA